MKKHNFGEWFFDVIITLATLDLRGHREDLDREGYHGNFLLIFTTCFQV